MEAIVVSRRETEAAKESVLEIEVKDAELERFTVTGAMGFGLELRATKQGKEAFFEAVEALGLVPEMNRRRATQLKGEYIYQIWVEVPEGWEEKSE